MNIISTISEIKKKNIILRNNLYYYGVFLSIYFYKLIKFTTTRFKQKKPYAYQIFNFTILNKVSFDFDMKAFNNN